MIAIVAVDNHWGIGNKGELLIKIPNDQQNFQRLTTGNVVVLGRKTLAGFPGERPLRDRTNIILSKNKDFSAEKATIVHTKEELLTEIAKYSKDDVFLIGGASVYKMLLPYCEAALVTRIDYRYDADAFFPNLDEDEAWELVSESEEQTYFSVEYTYQVYQNKKVKALNQ